VRLPNAENAVVDVAKRRGYCLNPRHPRGRHKARVFASALGIRAEEAEVLRDALLSAAREAEAMPAERDAFGQRYVLDFPMNGAAGLRMVRSRWIVRSGEDVPRLTSCYVL
jgi:hypothetical protein